MESPSSHGGSEEEDYNSCESGWTMYIQDAFHGNDHSSIVVDDEEVEDGHRDDHSLGKEADDGHDSSDDGGDEDSDDSMASDASSGPSNQVPENLNKHAARKNGSKQANLQKSQHTKKPLRSQGENPEQKAKTRTSAARRVQNRGKVTKTQ